MENVSRDDSADPTAKGAPSQGNPAPSGLPRTIYDRDTRQDIDELDEKSPVRTEARGVVLMVPQTALKALPGHRYELVTGQYGPREGLCPEVKYWDQQAVLGGSGTAFLVASDIVATAAHNLHAVPVADLRFVLGFQMPATDGRRFTFPAEDVYEPKEVLWSDTRRDGALVQLDRSVPYPVLARLRYAGTAALHTRLYMIGSPAGLPLKYAPDAQVLIRTPGQTFFEANLDGFKGNSGSPVYNADTRYVEGIFIREPDYDYIPDKARGCNVYGVLQGPQKAYTDVLDAPEFTPLVPGFQLLISLNSGLPAGIRDGSLAKGIPLIQESFTGGNSQWLSLEEVPGENFYRIVAGHSGMVLQPDIPWSEGAAIVQNEWNGSDAQKFAVEFMPYGRWRLVPKTRQDLCLDVRGGSTQPGAGIIQYRKQAGSPNQIWTWAAPVVNADTGRVADITGGSRDAYATVGTWPYHGGENQCFRVGWDIGGFSTITTANGTDMVWTEIDTFTGTKVVMLPYQAAWRVHQQWRILPAGDGLCWIEAGPSGYRVQPGRGDLLQCSPPDDQSQLQKWRLRTA